MKKADYRILSQQLPLLCAHTKKPFLYKKGSEGTKKFKAANILSCQYSR